MLSVWCIAHMKPSVWINPCLWAEALTGLHNCALCLHACVCVCVCVCLCVLHSMCPPRSTPQMGFHFNWQLPRSIRQDDKLGEGDCGGAPRMHPARYRGGSVSFVCASVRLLVCLSVCLARVFMTGSRIGQSRHQNVPPCVRWRVYAGCIACRSIDLELSVWSLAFVCQIYLSCRLSSPLSLPDTWLWHILSIAPVGK